MYLEQMPDREGGKYYKGRKLDTTVIEKVCVGPSWTEWTTDIWFRCHRNNWASSTNSCNPQRRFGLPRDYDSLHVLLTYDKMCECLHTISRLSRQNAPDAYTNINDPLMIHWFPSLDHVWNSGAHKRKSSSHDNLTCLKPLWAGQRLVRW